MNKCLCWFCNSTLIWNNDFSFEDYEIEGDGIIAVLTCTNCGATAEFYTEKDIE